MTGNMGFFITIIAMGQLGWLTVVASIGLSIAYRLTGDDGGVAPTNGTTLG